MVEKNQTYFGNFHQRLKRAPMMKTTKSPSIDAVMRRLIVGIGESLPDPDRRGRRISTALSPSDEESGTRVSIAAAAGIGGLVGHPAYGGQARIDRGYGLPIGVTSR
jgi:hypothetical protein